MGAGMYNWFAVGWWSVHDLDKDKTIGRERRIEKVFEGGFAPDLSGETMDTNK